MTIATVPRSAVLLGASGLLPSLAMLAAMVVLPGDRPAAATVGIAYGALIASFVGGAWWGLAAARADAAAQPRILVLSVVPCLLAWPALLIAPAAGLVLLAAVFAALPAMDRDLRVRGVAPDWWLSLRLPLSFGMATLHAASAAILLVSAP